MSMDLYSINFSNSEVLFTIINHNYTKSGNSFQFLLISSAWGQLYSGEITSTEFVSIASLLKGHVRQQLQVIANNPVEDDREMEERPDNIPAGKNKSYII